MLPKDSMELTDLFADQSGKEELEIHWVGEMTELSNLSVKSEMARELNGMALPREAIGRILHLREEVVDQHLDVTEGIRKDSAS